MTGHFQIQAGHQPRLLLRAIAAGMPVITTAVCGVTGLPDVGRWKSAEKTVLKTAKKQLPLDPS